MDEDLTGRVQNEKVIDVIQGHVSDIHGNEVYVKYMLKGKIYEARFSRDVFEKYNACFEGARIQLVTVKTADPTNPYDLRIRLKKHQPLRKLSKRVKKQLKILEELESDLP